MSAAHTPTTEDVRRNFIEQYAHESLPAALSMTSAEWDAYFADLFDHWLAEVKAAAWDECLEALAWAMDNGHPGDAIRYVATNNPHRTP